MKAAEADAACVPTYWRIWYSLHIRQLALIIMLWSWALSIGLTLFLARDNADLQKDKKKNMLIRKFAISQSKTADFVLTLTMRHPSWIFLFFGGRIVTFAPV